MDRISKEITIDRAKMTNFLKKIGDSRSNYREFLNNPLEKLEREGINISKFATEKVPAEVIADEIKIFVQDQLDRNYWSIWGRKISHMEESFSKKTEESASYNFDNSSSSSYRYESKTESTRGTTSTTSTGETTGTNYKFNATGFSLKEYEEMFTGPLISDKAIKVIIGNVEKNLNEIQNVR